MLMTLSMNTIKMQMECRWKIVYVEELNEKLRPFIGINWLLRKGGGLDWVIGYNKMEKVPAFYDFFWLQLRSGLCFSHRTLKIRFNPPSSSIKVT